ncbi:hypothetical protein FAZ15_04790 [Sphingobacterium olei]|uniref:PKD domain-containing protein n=1 Tax=Sphingobacterium olei TaxID=2571155 RepID=A0A4V5MMQ3_9SPHI|nr:PKD domain-containing protein [Sphingobacterium olei]TJZ61838.1 hypothetical protein FAZ15_04790 [Sphingobacterium olei]
MIIIKKYLYVALSLMIGFTSCSKEESPIIDEEGLLPKPTSSFTYTIPDPKDPFTVKFNNSSTNFVNSRWSFDDDSTSSEASPTHTFLKTGIFNVKLISLNEEGYWAQREETVNILPTELVELVATPSGENLRMSYNTDMTIGKTDWFVKRGSANYVQQSENADMEVNIQSGEFVNAYVILTTPKGSKTRLDMLLMRSGIVKDLTVYENEFSVSHENDGGKEAGEGSLKLIDNNINSKFLIFRIDQIGGPFHWQFEYFQPQVINAYTMTTGNDALGRDPKNWDMLASNDGTNWVTLDSYNDYIFPTTGGPDNNGRKATYTFTFDNTTPYHYYRLQVRAVGSGTLFQMGEFRMLQLPE